MEPDAANESLPETEALKPRNFFSRLGGVYSSPRKTFEEIGQAPAIWVPLIILLIISLLVSFYLSRHVDVASAVAGQLESAVQQGRITQQQAEQQLTITSKFLGFQLVLMATIGSLFSVLIVAGYAKLFSFFSDAENEFKPLLSVTIYVLIAIRILKSGLMILIMQLKGTGEVDLAHVNSIVASNLGALLASFLGDDALPTFVTGLANAVDVFAIWMIVLLAIGYSVVSKKLKTSTAALWIGIAYAIIAVISAAVSSLFNLSGTS
jgi:hypothetical protein